MDKELPLLRKIRCSFKNINLENVAIVAVQHILNSNYHLFKSFIKNNLKSENVYLLGKIYSSSKEIFKKFHNSNFNIYKESLIFDSHVPFDELFSKFVDRFIKHSINDIISKDIKNVIIIDDGGHLINAINDSKFSDLIVGSIEQTSSGYNILKKTKIKFPIINVARSNAKLYVETPFIIDSFMKRFSMIYPNYLDKTKSILILGKGIIGLKLRKVLKSKHFVHCHEPFYNNLSNEELSKFDLIIGASGITALPYESYVNIRKKIIFASISSSDREFDAYKFRRLFNKTNNPFTNFTNGNITLLQSGFPINFWGTKDNIPLKDIQLTISLMMAAFYQLLSNNKLKKGFNVLEVRLQKLIINNFINIKNNKRQLDYVQNKQFNI